jgi:hypothetical protein
MHGSSHAHYRTHSCTRRTRALQASDALLIVLANPSTYVWPSQEVRNGYSGGT